MLDNHGRIRDLSQHVTDLAGAALLPASMEYLHSLDPARLPEVAGVPRLGPCVGGVGKIIGVGLNYKDPAAESGMATPSEPPLFLKPPSAINGPNDDVEIPPGSENTDWEVELGVVIGTPGKHLGRACTRSRRRLLHRQRRLRARVAARARGSVGQGEGV